jgi:tRNA pseudouridine38-40 synthase
LRSTSKGHGTRSFTVKAARIALWVWYRGGTFRGFQSQREGPTVQDELKRLLALRGHTRTLFFSGRTDKGVHARMQAVSFKVEGGTLPDLEALIRGMSLPGQLGVAAARVASSSFHAQWSAIGKEYRYRFHLEDPGTASDPYCWEVLSHPAFAGKRIDAQAVSELIALWCGKRDFIAFHEKSSPQRLRTIHQAQLRPGPARSWEVTVQGDGFGRHQLRYLMGTTLAVAAGLLSRSAYCAALDQGAAVSGIRAPAKGLVLWEVHYPGQNDPFERDRSGPAVPSEPPFLA